MSFFGGAQERLSFILNLDDRGAIRAFGQVRVSAQRDLGEVDNRLDRIAGRMQVGGAAAVGFAAVAGRALFGLAQASEEAEAQSRRLDQALANNAETAGTSRQPYEDLAEALQDTTVAEGDAVIGLEGMLGTLGRTRDEILELTPLVVDLATRYGLDFEAAGRLVNSAIEGNTGRLERLIGQMREGESVADALARTVGGFAEREAQSLSGQLEILKNNLGDVAETMGAGVVDAAGDLIGSVTGVADALTGVDSGVLEGIGRWGTYGAVILGISGGASFLGGTLIRLRGQIVALTSAARASSAALGGARGLGVLGGTVAVVTAAAVAMDQFEDSMRDASHTAEDLARVGDEELIESIDGIVAAQERWGQSKEDIFSGMAREDIGVLQRYRDAVAATGRDTSDLDAALQNERVAQEQATETAEIGTGVLEDEADATGRLTRQTQGATDAVNRHREAIDRRREAMNEELEALLARFDTEIAHRNAERQTREAIEDLIEVTRDQESSTDDIAEAQDEAAESALRQASAMADLAIEAYGLEGATNEAAVRTGVMRGELQKVADSLAPGSPLRAQLQAFIDQLDELDERQIEVDILANYNLTGSGIPLLQTPTKRQHGGPIRKGQAYGFLEDDKSEVVVDDRGNATLFAGSDGKVIPNDRISLGVPAGMQVTQNITIGSNVSEFDLALTKREMKKAAQEAWRDIDWSVG